MSIWERWEEAWTHRDRRLYHISSWFFLGAVACLAVNLLVYGMNSAILYYLTAFLCVAAIVLNLASLVLGQPTKVEKGKERNDRSRMRRTPHNAVKLYIATSKGKYLQTITAEAYM